MGFFRNAYELGRDIVGLPSYREHRDHVHWAVGDDAFDIEHYIDSENESCSATTRDSETADTLTCTRELGHMGAHHNESANYWWYETNDLDNDEPDGAARKCQATGRSLFGDLDCDLPADHDGEHEQHTYDGTKAVTWHDTPSGTAAQHTIQTGERCTSTHVQRVSDGGLVLRCESHAGHPGEHLAMNTKKRPFTWDNTDTPSESSVTSEGGWCAPLLHLPDLLGPKPVDEYDINGYADQSTVDRAALTEPMTGTLKRCPSCGHKPKKQIKLATFRLGDFTLHQHQGWRHAASSIYNTVELLQRTCNRCGAQWFERPLDD